MQSSRILIVNADDFGFSSGVNEGIIKAHQDGILTSASLMVRSPAAPEAAQLARQHPNLSVGLHLELCEWVFEEGEWQLAYEVVSVSDAQAVQREVKFQLEQFHVLTGHGPTHLDTHQHVHRADPVRAILLKEAAERNIPLRSETQGIRYRGDFYGQSNKGEPFPGAISVEALVKLINSLPEGVTELGCHPASRLDFQSVYYRERVAELHSLCDPQTLLAIESNGIRLTSFLDESVQRLTRST